jgi:transcriptional regulator with XRE-family HTH domain
MEISPAKRVGKILELLRNEAGKTQAEVAKAAHCDHTFISHIEKGNKGAHIATLAAIGRAIDHEHVVRELWGFIGSPEIAATAELLAGYEAEAVRISVWTTTVFHALLQTEAYARAVIRSSLPFAQEGKVDELARTRLERQGDISRDNPPLLWAVIDESILYRPYGGDEVMREQLLRVEELAEAPSVVIQVMPYSAVRHPGADGALGIVEFGDKTPIWYTDGWSAGKLSDDRDEVADYMRYFDLIRAAALSPSESAEFIARIRRERYDG